MCSHRPRVRLSRVVHALLSFFPSWLVGPPPPPPQIDSIGIRIHIHGHHTPISRSLRTNDTPFHSHRSLCSPRFPPFLSFFFSPFPLGACPPTSPCLAPIHHVVRRGIYPRGQDAPQLRFACRVRQPGGSRALPAPLGVSDGLPGHQSRGRRPAPQPPDA